MNTRKLLITGFEPFGGENINSSWEAVSQLPEQIAQYHLTKLQIPTVFGIAAEKVLASAKKLHPDVILCIGQAKDRKAVTPEMIAINLRYATIPDNKGNQPYDEAIIENGPAAYFTTIPVRDIVTSIQSAGISADISYSAGTFVCNDLMYILLHELAESKTQVGFIHVPYLREKTKDGITSMPLEIIIRALEAAIRSI